MWNEKNRKQELQWHNRLARGTYMKKTVNRNLFLALCDAGGGTMPRSLDDVNKL